MSISDRIKLIRGSMTQKEFASKIDSSLGGVQSWESRDQVPNGNALIKIRDVFEVDINWLLTGDGEQYLNKNKVIHTNNSAGENVIEMKHQDIIKDFVDKPYAVELNMNLIELERLNPEAYRKVGSYIKGVVDGVKIVKQGAGHPDASAGQPPADSGDAQKKNAS